MKLDARQLAAAVIVGVVVQLAAAYMIRRYFPQLR